MAVVASAKDADLLAAITAGGEAGSGERDRAVKATILFCEGHVPPFVTIDALVTDVFPTGVVGSRPFDALADGWELYQAQRDIAATPVKPHPAS